jgi:hypothetical protein
LHDSWVANTEETRYSNRGGNSGKSIGSKESFTRAAIPRLDEPGPLKPSDYGNNGSKMSAGYSQLNKATSATNSREVHGVKENGLEMDSLLSRPVGPSATNEDLGCDPPNIEITCMEYMASSVAVVLLTQGECPSVGFAKQRSPLSLKKWKRAARNKAVGVCNGHSYESHLVKRKGDVEEVEKKSQGRGEKKLKGDGEQVTSDNQMAEAGNQ